MYVTNDQFLDKLENDLKKNLNGWFIAIFRILRQ